MPDAVFRVLSAGPHVSIQDGGRRGFMRFGVPASGPMDRAAFAAANAALGNPAGQPGIEISAGGLALECLSGALTLAVAGGGFILQAGGRRLGAWNVFPLRAGERLEVRPGPWGSWTYLAFAGRLAAREWLGSASTHALSGFGGGRIAAGQVLTVADAEPRPDRTGAIPCPVWARPRPVLHVVPGPQDRFFDRDAMAALLSAPFYLSDAYDRMGVRLRGPALMPQGALGIPSEPVPRGSIQVAGDGVATVLLADHQTTGGYPKIATAIADDLDGFAQLRPRDAVRFRAVTADEAVRMARQRANMRAAWLGRLGGGPAPRQDAQPAGPDGQTVSRYSSTVSSSDSSAM